MYKTFTLDNGVRVALEKIPHFRSISLGFWFSSGSVTEPIELNGISHFIEHMLFKGTSNRSAKQIAKEMDSIGGQLNAFTTKECTCFYSKVLDEHIGIAVDLLADMILNSTFDTKEIEKEKGVVLEELYMYKDSPEDNVHELLSSSFFKNHPLSKPIIGTEESINNLDKHIIIDYYNKRFSADNLVISVAGNYDEEELISLLNSKLASLPKTHKNNRVYEYKIPVKSISYKDKDIEQVHICIGMPGYRMGVEEVYPLMVLNNIFGGSMSSRLFQTIREDNGLTYSIVSYPTYYCFSGMYSVYACMKYEQLEKAIVLIKKEIDKILDFDITIDEVNSSIEQLKGNYMLGLESTSSRMISLGKSLILLDRIITPDKVIKKLDSVNLDSINRVAKEVFDMSKVNIASIGKYDPTELFAEFF